MSNALFSFWKTALIINPFLLVILFFISSASGQNPLNDITIIRDDGQHYQESEGVNKMRITLPDTEVEKLINKICGRVTNKGQFLCQKNDQYRNHKIAGLCFFPIWEEVDSDVATNLFRTVGLRVALALWNESLSPSEFIVAGFGDDFTSIRYLLPPVNESTMGTAIKEYTISISDNSIQGSNITLQKSFYSTTEEIEIVTPTQEFDFVFLDYEDYIALARSDIWYPKSTPRGDQKGIIIERSISGLEIPIITSSELEKKKTSKQNTTGTKLVNFRSLSFRPDPVPVTRNTITTVAVAYENGKQCPPYWRIGDDSTAFNGFLLPINDGIENLGLRDNADHNKQ